MALRAWPLVLAAGSLERACLPLAAQDPAAVPVRLERFSEPLPYGAKLRVHNRNGDITLTGWEREEIDLAAEIRDSPGRRIDLGFQRNASGLDIDARFHQPLLGFAFTSSASPRCRMLLHVPRRILAYVRTTNGSLAVTGVDGYVQVESTNGDISLGGVAGEVDAETSNGNVEARGLHARIRGGTSNGRILLDEVDGQVSMLCSNGSIQARNLDGWSEGISLECTNGPIDLELGRTTGELLAVSLNGTVKVQVPGALAQESGRHRVRVRIPGRAQKINLTTTNGDIQVH
jgi:hypothetical protein